MSESSKRCGTCKQIKPLYCFSKNKRKKDGLQNACKECANIRSAQYHKQHRDAILERKKEYRVDNLERIKDNAKRYYAFHKKERADYHRNYHIKNRDRELEKSRKYRKEHLERLREQNRQYHKINYANIAPRKRRYRQDNPEKIRFYTAKRRTQKLSLPNNFNEHDWAHCLAYWKNSCAICGRTVGENSGYTLAADHWIPLSDPRPDNPGTVPGNILPLCHGTSGCNNSKKNAEPLQWLVRYLGATAAEQKLIEITAYFNWLEAQSETEF